MKHRYSILNLRILQMFKKVLILVVFLTSVYCQVCFPGDTCIRSADDSSDSKNTNLRRTIKQTQVTFFKKYIFLTKLKHFSTIKNTEKRKIYLWFNITFSFQVKYAKQPVTVQMKMLNVNSRGSLMAIF